MSFNTLSTASSFRRNHTRSIAPAIPIQIVPLGVDFTKSGSNGTASVSGSTPVSGTYTVKNSTFLANSDTYHGLTAFNSSTLGTSSQGWIGNECQTNTLSTMSVNTIGTISGGWIEIDTPMAFKLTTWEYYKNAAYSYRLPRRLYVLGSNNGTSWDSVQYTDGILDSSYATVTISGYNYSKKVFTTNSPTKYTRYRFFIVYCQDTLSLPSGATYEYSITNLKLYGTL